MMTREELLKWAAEHKYPALRFTGLESVKLHPVQGRPEVVQPMKYAIGIDGCKDNKMFWEVAIRTGKDDMVNGVLEHIKSLSKEQLTDMKNPIAARARARGMKLV
jgi:hypothetical protein